MLGNVENKRTNKQWSGLKRIESVKRESLIYSDTLRTFPRYTAERDRLFWEGTVGSTQGDRAHFRLKMDWTAVKVREKV